MNTKIFRLNYSGIETYFYFIFVPESELQTYVYNLDEYPIYVYYTDINNIDKKYPNFYEFINAHIDNKTIISKFSKKSIKQYVGLSNLE